MGSSCIHQYYCTPVEKQKTEGKNAALTINCRKRATEQQRPARPPHMPHKKHQQPFSKTRLFHVFQQHPAFHLSVSCSKDNIGCSLLTKTTFSTCPFFIMFLFCQLLLPCHHYSSIVKAIWWLSYFFAEAQQHLLLLKVFHFPWVRLDFDSCAPEQMPRPHKWECYLPIIIHRWCMMHLMYTGCFVFFGWGPKWIVTLRCVMPEPHAFWTCGGSKTGAVAN